jgi:probable DNA metabolism protein
MISYMYDGTFEGLLTVIAGAISGHAEVCEISAGDLSPDLFTEIKQVATDQVLADHFLKNFASRISKTVLLDIGYCFLSEDPGIEKVIFDFMCLLLLQGEPVTRNFSDPTIFKIRRTCDQVAHEIQRMYEFVRFRKLHNGVYYAPISPDHNVIQLIAPHFKDRFADQLWLIHDTTRKTAIHYDGHQCRFIPWLEMSDEVITANIPFRAGEERSIYDGKEMAYQKIWDQYFQHIAIPERLNKRQQRQRMPERYWKYLVENVEG